MNLNAMSIELDKLGHQKNTEQMTRLKLEEEFMTVMRNHEEEVKLRLQFEARVNQLNQQYRSECVKSKRALSLLQKEQAEAERLR
jgi:hypothetical protein